YIEANFTKRYFLAHRDLAALDAISARFSGLIALALALPPLRPSAAAAGSLPCSSGVGGRSSISPVAMSITSLAAWLKSRGRFRRFSAMLAICARIPEIARPSQEPPFQTDPLPALDCEHNMNYVHGLFLSSGSGKSWFVRSSKKPPRSRRWRCFW